MEKATEGAQGKGRVGRKTRGKGRPKPAVTEEHKLAITAPPGSQFKGYEPYTVQELRVEARVIRYCRERWLTPGGETLVAPCRPACRGILGQN